jgi:hypothetical protein
MRKTFKWATASRARKVTVGFLSTFLVAGAAFAFFVGVLSSGSGTVNTHLGANGAAGGTFQITADPNSPLPTNLQPGTCTETGGNWSQGDSCEAFGLIANNSTSAVGTVQSVTLTGITVPAGCPADSIELVWPSGTTTTGTGASATYQEPASFTSGGTNSPLYVAANATGVELFPGQATGSNSTANGMPYLYFKDDGTDQNACASGAVSLTFSATAS